MRGDGDQTAPVPSPRLHAAAPVRASSDSDDHCPGDTPCRLRDARHGEGDAADPVGCGIMTTVIDDPGRPTEAPLPADPEKYDEYRNVAARKRGLTKPYIPGGEDPELQTELARERPYVRLLLVMVAVIVALGFVLGIVSAVITSR